MIFCALTLPLISSVPISHSEESLSVEEVYAIICQPQYNWNCDEMVKISWRESKYHPTATNPDCYPNHLNPATSKPYICAGLLQVMETHVPYWPDLLDPYYNIEVAYRVWLSDKGAWGD